MPDTVIASTYLSSLNQALHALMRRDERVLVLGEDILDPYGGAFKVSKGLSTAFPTRVFTTPIAESAIVGVAVGLAMRGARPIAEIMFGDFLTLAADQLINHAAKFRWMYNDRVAVPVIVRAPMGGWRSYGATHSQSLEKHFIGVPGLWVVSPNVLGNPGALLRQAVEQTKDPVLFIEHKYAYAQPLLTTPEGMAMETIRDEEAPFPTLFIRHRNPEQALRGVLFCYGGMVSVCLEAVKRLRDEEGIFMDMAVFSQLSPLPYSHVKMVLGKCSIPLFVYVEEASPMGGWASEVIATVEDLRPGTNGHTHTHVRIGSRHSSLPSSRELERQILPDVEKIMGHVLECF